MGEVGGRDAAKADQQSHGSTIRIHHVLQGGVWSMKVSITVNGVTATHDVEPRLLLVHYLREVLTLTGTHIGCDTTSCGACTVMLNGLAVKSCTVPAAQADGGKGLTVEGLA